MVAQRSRERHSITRGAGCLFCRERALKGLKESFLPPQTSPSRRIHSRIESVRDVYVYWRSAGHEHLAPVRNLSIGGLFIETDTPTATGMSADIHFLVQEGQIRADAVVRHAAAGRGIGLKFTAVRNEDRLRLAELLKRVRHRPDPVAGN